MNPKTELDRIKTTITVSKRVLNKLKKKKVPKKKLDM